jgi:hypothetical protein
VYKRQVGGWATLAQDVIPQVIFENTAEGYTVPAEVPAGIVNVLIDNNTPAPSFPLLARLNEGVTPDDLMAAMSEGPMAAMSLLSLLGGTLVYPDAELDFTVNLNPGVHLLLDFVSETAPPQIFVVAGEPAAVTGPAADIEAVLYDFSFTLPLEIPAGPQTWHIVNNGSQWHEILFMQIDDNTTVAEVRAMVAHLAEEDPAERALPAAIWAPMIQGQEAWVTFDLAPGTYLVTCVLPDFASGQAHAHKGMVQIISVVENDHQH